MARDRARGAEPFRVRVEHLMLGPNPPAGMNVLVLMSLAYTLRSTAEDPDPVEVTQVPPLYFRVHDGRHRAMAAIVAGRRDVLCVLVRPDP
jgi:hypothetical protein